MRSFFRYPESLFVIVYFAVKPLELLLWHETSVRTIIIYGVVPPIVCALLLARHQRARFAAYIFLSMEMIRAVRAESIVMGALAIGILLLMQLPRVRAVWPRVDARRIADRYRRRR